MSMSKRSLVSTTKRQRLALFLVAGCCPSGAVADGIRISNNVCKQTLDAGQFRCGHFSYTTEDARGKACHAPQTKQVYTKITSSSKICLCEASPARSSMRSSNDDFSRLSVALSCKPCNFMSQCSLRSDSCLPRTRPFRRYMSSVKLKIRAQDCSPRPQPTGPLPP